MDAKSHSRETKRLRLQRILEDHAVGVEEPKCQGQDYGLSGSADSSDAFVIVIMTYKRVGKLEKTLNFLSQFGMGGSLSQNFLIDIIITQTCDTDDPDSVDAVENLIQRVKQKVGEGQVAPFRSIKHVKVSLMKFDDSYSTDKKMYGNKRNSLQNLKNGLSVALARHPGAKDFFVLEDDAVVSSTKFPTYNEGRYRISSVTIAGSMALLVTPLLKNAVLSSLTPLSPLSDSMPLAFSSMFHPWCFARTNLIISKTSHDTTASSSSTKKSLSDTRKCVYLSIH